VSGKQGAGAVGVFGGTFDPVHYGHLRTALELLEYAGLEEMRFIPAGTPPHRATPHADGATRLALVQAAIAGEPRFCVDDRELRRDGPSWTVDTLRQLRAELRSRPLCLVVGMDAFIGLTSWHRWEEILDLAHLLVAHRPGWEAPVDGVLGQLLRARRVETGSALQAVPAGRIGICAVTQLEISSSAIRELVRAGREPRYLVPDPVCRLLAASGCYTAAAERH
jgi:nicotinate-nucleotide adenylyltransferase